MRLIFEFIYNILDVYLHRIRIKNYLKKLDLNCKNIIDIGSHKGESIDFLLQMYHKSKIFGFEPQYDCYNYLKKKFNSKNNVKVVNSALGKIKGSKKLYKNLLSTTSTFSTLNSNSKHYKIKSFLLGNKSAGFYNNEIVKINTLSYFIKKFKVKKIDLLKIDTEGHELEVLLGSKKDLKNIRLILIEHNFTDYYLNYNLKKVSSYLNRNYFKNIKNFKFPFMNYTDSIYINTKLWK